MGLISEQIAEKTWQEVAAFSPIRANNETMKIGSNQLELLAFTTESTEEMGPKVKEIGIYVFLVVYRMSQKIQGKIKRISSEEIINCHEQFDMSSKSKTFGRCV